MSQWELRPAQSNDTPAYLLSNLDRGEMVQKEIAVALDSGHRSQPRVAKLPAAVTDVAPVAIAAIPAITEQTLTVAGFPGASYSGSFYRSASAIL
jgi:hypothetical protein